MIEFLRDLVWGPWLMALFLLTGIYFTVRFRCFQLVRANVWWRETAGSLAGEKSTEEKKGQFASACTALAATVGTGNIAGVATAVTMGGPGAVFWMWVSALFGMMTAYAEVYLGRKYRYLGLDSCPICGPYAYLERGLGMRGLACLYAVFCILSSLGMGSMVQANSVAESAAFSAGIPLTVTGFVLTALVMAVIFGGARRISQAAVGLVPLSAAFYMALCGVVILTNFTEIPSVFVRIFRDAWSADSAAGGMAGLLVSRAVRYGISRGVFSNEAGLGSLAVLHGEAEEEEGAASGEGKPGCSRSQSRERFACEQGMWAVFEVFFDTMVSCTMTALALLCGGDTMNGYSGSAGVAACFSSCFGNAGGILVSLSMSLFAFATIIAWFYLGRQALAYLTDGVSWQRVAVLCYGFFYLNAVFFGCVARLTLVWNLSDLFNGLMAVPNLAGVLLLRKEVRLPAWRQR